MSCFNFFLTVSINNLHAAQNNPHPLRGQQEFNEYR